MNAFNVLSSRRQYGMSSPQPLLMSEIVAYLNIFRWHDVETFVNYIILLDGVFMKHSYDEYKRKNPDKKPKSKSR